MNDNNTNINLDSLAEISDYLQLDSRRYDGGMK